MFEQNSEVGEFARLATKQDIPSIEDIRERHLQSIEGQRGAALLKAREIMPPVGFTPLSAAIEKNDCTVLSGGYDSVVFGYGFAVIEQLDPDTRIGRLTEFIVDAEIRKSGIGEAMMNLLVEILRSQGCSGIDSQALPGDRDTKNFFESFGLKARLLTVHRSI